MQVSTRRSDCGMVDGTGLHAWPLRLGRGVLAVFCLWVCWGVGVAMGDESALASESRSAPDIAFAASRPVEALHYRGVVVDKVTGQPVAGAVVTVHRRSRSSGDVQRFAEPTQHTTSEKGEYEFTLPPEQAGDPWFYVDIEANHPGYGRLGPSGYSLCMLLKNERLGEKPFFTRLEMAPGEEVTGVIVGSDGQSVANASVEYVSVAAVKDPGMASGADRASGETKTDAQGRFRFNAIKGGKITEFVVASAKDAALRQQIGEKRGDIGEIRLKAGERLTGTVVDVKGKPIADARVQAFGIDGKDVHLATKREGQTDVQGRFRLDPLGLGKYTVHVTTGYWPDPDSTKEVTPPVAVFRQQAVSISSQEPPDELEFRAVPHVTVRAQCVDGAGKPTRGPEVFLIGDPARSGFDYQVVGYSDPQGTVVALAPRGLERAMLMLISNEHTSLRFRQGKDGELTDGRQISLGNLDQDVDDVTIVRYVAPIVLIRVSGPDGTPIKECTARIGLPEGSSRGRRWSVTIQRQDDGKWRTWQLLPDQEYTITVEGKGYRPVSQSVKLAEGEIREMNVLLTPVDSQPAKP